MKNLARHLFLIIPVILTYMITACTQESSMKHLELKDMSSFDKQAGNWMIVGEVTMDTSINAYHNVADTHKWDNLSKAVKYKEGVGILLNMNNEKKKSHLITSWEHGDIELKTEVMLPKGSNSGIYLQGRYEVQLFDSWGVVEPTFADMGGIYENWEKDPEKAFKGEAPLVNAAKAPGVWQTLTIVFKAPVFSSEGNKISNAVFETVELNGTQIHDNVEVPWPTGGPVENNEVSKGPIRLQGDHGPVAFRNFRYRLLSD